MLIVDYQVKDTADELDDSDVFNTTIYYYGHIGYEETNALIPAGCLGLISTLIIIFHSIVISYLIHSNPFVVEKRYTVYLIIVSDCVYFNN